MNDSGLATGALVASAAGFLVAPVIGPVIGLVLGYTALSHAGHAGQHGAVQTRALAAVVVGWAALALPAVVLLLLDDDLAPHRGVGLVAVTAIVMIGVAIGARLGGTGGRAAIGAAGGTVVAVGAASLLAIAGVLGAAWLFVFMIRLFWQEIFGLVLVPGGW